MQIYKFISNDGTFTWKNNRKQGVIPHKKRIAHNHLSNLKAYFRKYLSHIS